MKEISNLYKNVIDYSIYSTPYISYLIKKLLEYYENEDYILSNLNNINLNKWVLYSDKSKNNDIISESIIINEINKAPLLYKNFNLKSPANKNISCFAPSFYRYITSDINSLNDDVIIKYPIIQKFIDFIFLKRLSLSDESIFIANLKDYFEEFISLNRIEKNPINKTELINKETYVDCKTLFNSIKYVINKFEYDGLCGSSLALIAYDKNDEIFYHVYNVLDVFTRNEKSTTEVFIGDSKEKDYKKNEKYPDTTNIDIREFIVRFSENNLNLKNKFKYLPDYLGKLYNLSLEKDYITNDDITMLLANLNNDLNINKTRN